MRILLFLVAASLSAQTTIYVRSGGPFPVVPTNSASGTPPTITTASAHGFAVNDVIGIWGACSGTKFDPASGRTPLNGLHKVLATSTSTTFTISDGPASSSPASDSNNWVECNINAVNSGGGRWAAKYTAVTLPDGPLGWFDGKSGPVTRKLALGTHNGLTSLVVTGSNLATVTTSYSHGLITGDKVSIHGAGATSSQVALNTANGTGADAPYTVTVTDGTHFTFPVAGVSNGTYTGSNNTCGPPATPNDLPTGGTADCLRISQLAYTGNPMWDALVADTDALYGTGHTTDYEFPLDNPTTGYYPPATAYEVALRYSNAAVKFLVDPSDSTSGAVAIYFAKHFEYSFSAGWQCYADILYQACGVTGGGLQGDQDEIWAGLSFITAVVPQYLSTASRGTFIDKIYNDIADPASTVVTTNTDLSNDRQNKVIVTGHAGSAQNDTTHITLASGDTAATNFYVNNVVHVFYQTTITGISVGASTTFTTASEWGFGKNIPIAGNSAMLYISGVTGTNCAALNAPQPVSEGGYAMTDSTHFSVPNVPGCTSPTGGTVTSYEIQCSAFNPCAGLITAYNSTTKVATMSGGFGGSGLTASSDMMYKIYETMSISSQTWKASATVTGYNTHFTTEVAVGDIVMGANGYATTGGSVWTSASYVTAVTNDTTLTVLNQSSVKATSTPSVLWVIHKWQAGDTGWNSYGKHWQGAIGSQPVLYPPSGGGLTMCPGGAPCPGSNNGILLSFAQSGVDLNLAPYDSRPASLFSLHYSYALDYEFAHYINYISGQAHSGAVYSLGNIYGTGFMATTLFPSMPSFPAIDTGWAKNTALYSLYSILPDLNWNADPPRPTPMSYGTESGQGYIDSGTAMEQAYGLNPVFSLAPLSDEAKHLAYFVNQYGFWNSRIGHRLYFNSVALLHNDPRSLATATSYNTLPNQYAFLKADPATCIAATGGSCPTALNGASVISRTGWSGPSSTTGRDSTLTYFGMQAYAGDHSLAQCGSLFISKVGQLLGIDGTGTLAYLNDDSTNVQDMPRLGNVQTTLNGGYAGSLVGGLIPYGYCPNTQWASSNHGSWNPQFGDQDSKYAYACADLTNSYVSGTMTWGRRCFADLKDTAINSGTGEQIIVRGTFIDASTPIAIEGHIHYPQNGQTYDIAQAVGMTYAEGQTTCPGSGGCANLNTNRTIQSLETGDAPITPMSITSITPGATTAVITSGTSGAVLNQFGTLAGITGSGCNGTGIVQSITNSTHFTLVLDTTGCSSPSYSGATFLNDLNMPRTYGIISKFISPGTVMLRDDSFSVTVSSVTAGNPTIFTATANGIKVASGITTITSPGPTPYTSSAYTELTLATPILVKVDPSNTVLKISGVTSTGGSCDAINTGMAVVAQIDSTHVVIIFNSSACTGTSGGLAIPQPEANVKILGATGDWAALNSDQHNGVQACSACFTLNNTSVLPMTFIDADHFSVPINSTGFAGSFDGQVYAAYPGAYGQSHRISVCGGSTCGFPVSSYQFVEVHKVAKNLSDTTLTADTLTVDSNWVGVQTLDKVILLSRGQNPQSTISSFTTTHPGTAQYLFGNVTAGNWTVTVGGSAVTGSPFTVSSGDNSIYFESAAGTVVATLGEAPPTGVIFKGLTINGVIIK